MIGSKLLKLLSTLSSTEFRRMRKIFQSPFFTTNERHLVLYELLRKYHPIFDTPRLEKEKVFEILYPGKPFNDGLLRVLVREFTQMTEEYLLIQKLRNENFQRKKMLSQIYKDRNLYDFFARETKALLKDLEKQPFRDWDYYREIYELNFDYFFHPNTQKLGEGDVRLLEIMQSLDRQFALGKFRIGSEMINRTRTLAKNYEIHLLEEVKNFAEADLQKNNVLFELFSLLFQLYESVEKDVIFEELKKLFSQNFRKLMSIDQSLFLTQLINYAIRKTNIGESRFSKEALDLYKIGLEAELVLKDGSIDEAVYGNIITLGCHAKEFDWVENFLNEYKSNLKEEIREDAFTLNKGFLFFNQKEFEKAQNQFLNYNFSPRYQAKARSMLIQTFYEQFIKDESIFDLLEAQLNSFEKYIKRNKEMVEYRREGYLNWTSSLKKLVKGIIQRKNPKDLKRSLEIQINEKQRIIGKKWILQKIAELK